jgi:flavin reductase (DIM6/NTAB) family NADH-FMN oxidoreductase RutF
MTRSATDLDLRPDTLRSVFSTFPTGVVAVCGIVSGARVGMAVSSFTSVSLDPPLVAFCVQRTSRTWPTLRMAPRLGVSVLASSHACAARTLASKDGDRFAGVDTITTDSAVHIRGSVSDLTCSLRNTVDAGDHLLVILQVHTARADGDVSPLVFHRSGFTSVAPHVDQQARPDQHAGSRRP